MRKIIRFLIIVICLIAIGWIFYATFIKNDTKEETKVETFTVDALSTEELSQLDEETQTKAKEYKYNETYDSFDLLDKEKQEDGSYSVPKYSQQKLYLIIATKKADGTVIAIFSDEN